MTVDIQNILLNSKENKLKAICLLYQASNIKYEEIAKSLDISLASFYRVINGEVELKYCIVDLTLKIFHITQLEFAHIFSESKEEIISLQDEEMVLRFEKFLALKPKPDFSIVNKNKNHEVGGGVIL